MGSLDCARFCFPVLPRCFPASGVRPRSCCWRRKRMHLTKRAIDALKPDGTEVIHFDDALPGFGLRLKPSGVKSYLVQYRAKGRTRRVTIGLHGRLTAEQARGEARKLLGRVAQGEDPAEHRREAHQAETVAGLCKRYMEHHALLHKKPGSVRNDRQMIR